MARPSRCCSITRPGWTPPGYGSSPTRSPTGRILTAAEEREKKRWDKRHLSFGLTLDNTGVLSGSCGDAVSYEIVRTAAEAFSPPAGQLDTRTAAQRRMDGLVAACKAALDGGSAPERHGSAPHITVLVKDETLAQAAAHAAAAQVRRAPGYAAGTSQDVAAGGGQAAFEAGPAAQAGGTRPAWRERRRAKKCMHHAYRAPGPRPLLRRRGRRDPLARRAAPRRRPDRPDRAAGPAPGAGSPRPRLPVDRCGALAARATAHHIRPWSKGGATSLSDLALFCHLHHHYFITSSARTITGDPNGTLYFTDPGGCSPWRAPSQASEQTCQQSS